MLIGIVNYDKNFAWFLIISIKNVSCLLALVIIIDFRYVIIPVHIDKIKVAI